MPKREAFCSMFLKYKGKRLRLLTVALDTGSAVAFAPLSGMTIKVKGGKVPCFFCVNVFAPRFSL
jgi:hypothetical protein